MRKKKTFYVNKIAGRGDWNHQYIGLFTSNQWVGEGNFCGYYGAEFYLNTKLLSYGIQLKPGNLCYDPKAPFDGGFIAHANENHLKIGIGSKYWEKRIEAYNQAEAIEIFRTQSWQD